MQVANEKLVINEFTWIASLTLPEKLEPEILVMVAHNSDEASAYTYLCLSTKGSHVCVLCLAVAF